MKTLRSYLSWLLLNAKFALVFLAVPTAAQSFQSTKADTHMLSPAAQAQISSRIGEDQQAYQFVPQGGGYLAENGNQSLSAGFTSEGVVFQQGSTHWRVALQGYGHGAHLRSSGVISPQAHANRLEYRRGMLTEWYSNGPFGIEQGFTIERAPDHSRAEPLTIALLLSGNVAPSVDSDRRGLTLRKDGVPALRYKGLSATDANGRELPAWLEISGDQLLVHVDEAGAKYPVQIDPFIQQAQLSASDVAQADLFGTSLAVDGDTVVVGAPGASSNQGAAYVFVKPSGGWKGSLHESAKLTASDGASGNYFGSVGISGDTVVVGAYYANVGGNTLQGAAYVFVKPTNGWSGALTENAKLTASDGREGDHFGGGVAISGDTIVVGKAQDYCCNPQLAEAYVFVKPSGGWSGDLQEQARLSNPQEADDYVLVRVGIGGSTIVAGFSGLPGQSSNFLNVFVKPSAGWSGALTPTATLSHSDGTIPGVFAVNNAGDMVVVGTPFGQGSVDSAAGYIFLQPNGGWTGVVNESAKLTESDGLSDNQFADAVAVKGDTVVLGTDVVFSEQTDCKCELNGAYIYVKPASGWSGSLQQNQKLIVSNAVSIDYGNSVALSDDLVLVDAAEGGSSSGGLVYASAKISGDFSLEDVPPVTMATDSSATPTVTVDSLTDYLGTFSNPVALTITGAPTGVATSLSPASVTPPANGSADSTLTVQVGPAVTPQSFLLTLTGTYSALTHSKTVNVTVAATIGGTTQVIGTEQALGCIDNSGIANALTSKLAQAQQFISAGNIQAAINTLTALLNQLYAQQGKHIKTSCTDANGNVFDPDQVLIADVQALLSSLGAATIKPNPVIGYALNSSGVGTSGALVTIVDAGKNVIASAKTDATGFYFFAQTKMLVSGARYTLRVSPPKPYKSGTAPIFTWTGNMVTANSTVN